MRVETRLEPGSIRPEQELADAIGQASGDGALVSFVGLARPADSEERQVVGLFLDHHPHMTLQSLDEIAAGASRFEVSYVRLVHRCGDVAPGEAIVFVAAAARHRRAAFDAADYLMDRLKTDAMFWKREDRSDGSSWIEPVDSDHAARQRWSD